MCILAPCCRADTAAGLAEFRQGRFAEALQDWEEQAAAGDGRAALFVGVLYDTGLGAQQDYGAALAWYRKAADAGNANAAFNVAVMNDAGLGTPASPAQALAWYTRSAGMGYARAQYNLGLLYETGAGVKRDVPRAVTFFRAALAQGLTAARAHLTRLGASASAVSPTPSDTAMDEFGQAQQALLRRGPADLARAVEMFRRAADRRNPLAEYDLAYCYEHGMGVERDRVTAYGLYRRAAEHTDNALLRSVALSGMHSAGSRLATSEVPQDR